MENGIQADAYPRIMRYQSHHQNESFSRSTTKNRLFQKAISYPQKAIRALYPWAMSNAQRRALNDPSRCGGAYPRAEAKGNDIRCRRRILIDNGSGILLMQIDKNLLSHYIKGFGPTGRIINPFRSRRW